MTRRDLRQPTPGGHRNLTVLSLMTDSPPMQGLNPLRGRNQVKTKSTHGGKRAGAGRKPRKPEITETSDSRAFLEQVMCGTLSPSVSQMKAAKALLPFQHQKLGETGKKDQRNADAGKVAGRFAPAPPRLALVKREPPKV